MIDTSFKQDFVDLLLGKRAAHLGGQMYADHKGYWGSTPMSGTKLWTQLADEEATYPISRADIKLLQHELPSLSKILPKNLTMFDLGPGGEKSIADKSMRIIKATDATTYRPVDSSELFVRSSSEAARKLFPTINISPHIGNIFSGIFGVVEPTLAYFGGGTLANLIYPASDQFPHFLLEDALDGLTSYAPYGWLLLSFDSTNDETELYKRYSSDTCNQFVCNIMYRAAVELPMTGFDPSKFLARCHWNKISYQMSHWVEATESQCITLDDISIQIEAGQRFHITNSYKFPQHVFEEAVSNINYTVDYCAHEESGMMLYLLRSPLATTRLHIEQRGNLDNTSKRHLRIA